MTDEELRGLFDGLRTEIGALRTEVRQELKQEIGTLRTEFREELQQEIGTLRTEFRQELADTRNFLNDKLDYFMDDTTKKFALVHEGLVMLNEKIDREAGDIRSEMRAGFEETHALIRISHADLDRRVTRLENEVF